MSINHSARSGGIIGISLRFSVTGRYICVLDEAILKSTHNIPFSIKKKRKIDLNYLKSAAIGFFLGSKARVRNSTSW